jgi:hypothetical protein
MMLPAVRALARRSPARKARQTVNRMKITVATVMMLTLTGDLLVERLDARSERVRISSQWRNREVVVDGSDTEWPGPLVRIDEKHPVSVAAVNDGQFLCLVLTSSDASARRQILRQGLIVWFDPAGKDKKHFGIKFPVGMEVADPVGGPTRGGGARRGGPTGGRTPRDRDPSSADAFEPPNRLEVLGPKKDDARSLVADRVPGLEVRIGQVEGSLIYELKVPIARTAEFEYAIGAAPGALIGLGLETPKLEGSRGGFGGLGGGGMGRPGGGVGRGGGMGGRGGGMGRGGQDRPKPIKAWAALQLAVPSTTIGYMPARRATRVDSLTTLRSD